MYLSFTYASLFMMYTISRTLPLLSFPATLRPVLAARLYATQTSLGTSPSTPQPRRKAVTPFNDDGRVAWGDLSAKEKAARTTQQTFNFGFIILGAILTVRSDFKMAFTDANYVRGAWHTLCTPKCSLLIVRRAISIEQSIKSRKILDVLSCWGTARRS